MARCGWCKGWTPADSTVCRICFTELPSSVSSEEFINALRGVLGLDRYRVLNREEARAARASNRARRAEDG